MPTARNDSVSPSQATGSVELLDDQGVLALGQLRNGTVSFLRSFGTPGTYHLTAQYLVLVAQHQQLCVLGQVRPG